MQQTTEAPVPMTFFFGAENPLSNWHPAGFTVNGVDFRNNEQFMMYCKAKLFGDDECAAKILRAETPREHKALGRSVRGFEESKWAQKCEHYVFVGSLAKFRQNGVVSPNPRNFPLQPANFLMRSARRPNASSTHSIVMGSARAARREFL